MRRFLAELEVSARLEVEVRAGSLQLAHAGRTFLDQHLDRFGVAERRARGERVLPMQLRRIAGAERGGDAALGVGGGAVEQGALGEHHHVAFRRRAPGGMQTRQLRFRQRESGFGCARPCHEINGEPARIERGAPSCRETLRGRISCLDAETLSRGSGAACRACRAALCRRRVALPISPGRVRPMSGSSSTSADAATSRSTTVPTPARTARSRSSIRTSASSSPAKGPTAKQASGLLAAEGDGSRHRRRLHLHRRHHEARKGISRRCVRWRRLRAVGRRQGQCHPAARQSRGAQVSRRRRLIPRRRTRCSRRQVEEDRVRRRNGHSAHSQVRSRLSRRREAGLPRLHSRSLSTPA